VTDFERGLLSPNGFGYRGIPVPAVRNLAELSASVPHNHQIGPGLHVEQIAQANVLSLLDDRPHWPVPSARDCKSLRERTASGSRCLLVEVADVEDLTAWLSANRKAGVQQQSAARGKHQA